MIERVDAQSKLIRDRRLGRESASPIHGLVVQSANILGNGRRLLDGVAGGLGLC